ncbi:MAG: asparagine--tRNA ligase [Bacteroidota bacterium]
MKRTTIRELFQTPSYVGEILTLQGWVMHKRASKQVVFIALNDGSTLQHVQVVIAPEQLSEGLLQDIAVGASVQVVGTLITSSGQEQSVELQATEVSVLGPAPAYPLQPKKHSLAFLRKLAHLRFRTQTMRAVFRIRHAVSYAIHQFFHERHFVYLHTPINTGIDAEGAGSMFHVTTLDATHLPQDKPGEVDFTQDFFGQPTHLTVTGQLGAEAAAFGLGAVYTFGPTFRAEDSNTTRHLAEFWMVEPEMAFYDLADTLVLAEALVKHIITSVLTHCVPELNFLQKRLQHAAAQQSPHTLPLIDKLATVLATPFQRITYTEAINIFRDLPPHLHNTFTCPIRAWGADLQAEHERYLVEQHFQQPVIITDYPAAIKAFYMRQNEDNATVAGMDILLPGVGEIIGGSQREERLDRLEAAMQHRGMDMQALQWYLDTRRFGTVVHSGFGLGLERCLQFLTGMENIRDVIPFPRTPGHAAF